MKATALLALALAAVVAASPVAEPELVEQLTALSQVRARATVPLWRRAPAPVLALRALVAIPPATAPSTLLVFVTIARSRQWNIRKRGFKLGEVMGFTLWDAVMAQTQ
ncbi:hypothetical protein IFM58399_04991 [Aspergillus lentulus]|uniref:Uncharacterized protein n=1 Tax=Aspergillus lentulus TaxID=293939 RepID=A0ABQ1ADK7_ASPLE|nr:uncharacterized protein IFM58399_04991 [Aspergillus lentulus]KAF4157794.1 hypothetical protein CNMCM6069_005046 [Aspergillus lentulus]KAF4162184.1 hypothetical protein CNMCM6936_002424 [Aspergillus lentulus]KAF4176751.1 hypothetical protein CNMCM8060_006028 [Aspergillus lentulus]KAF4185044.1 hypothetical protein CNMCM7927_007182 [Aspergillus lentulus]KAF4195658.1 hypothetical protein CNMCM8694_005931 [Aspergillus lentulus]